MRLSDVSLLFALVVAAMFFAAGCGAGLKTHAVIGRAMLETQTAAGPIIRSARIAAGVEAGREAHAAGLPEDVAQARAADAADEWQCAITGHRLFSSAVGSYVDVLVLWEAGADFTLGDVIPFVLRAANDYRSLAACVATIDGADDALPVPAFFDLIPSDWTGESETLEEANP